MEKGKAILLQKIEPSLTRNDYHAVRALHLGRFVLMEIVPGPGKKHAGLRVWDIGAGMVRDVKMPEGTWNVQSEKPLPGGKVLVTVWSNVLGRPFVLDLHTGKLERKNETAE